MRLSWCHHCDYRGNTIQGPARPWAKWAVAQGPAVQGPRGLRRDVQNTQLQWAVTPSLLGSRIPARCDDECPVKFMVGQVSGQVRECLAAKGPAVLKLGPDTSVLHYHGRDESFIP